MLFISFVGAVISKKINDGSIGFLWFVIPSLFSGALWGHISKMPHRLSFMSTVFDTVYSATYLICFVLMGEKINLTQLSGFIIAMFGIYLMH